MKKIFSLIILQLVSISAFAQSQLAVSGQPNQIKIPITNATNTSKCHIEITLPNQQKVGIEVEPPQFIASFEFTPQQTGSVAIAWEGKAKVRGLNTVFACPGSGVIQVQVNGNTEQVTQQWNQYFSRVPEEIKDCVKVGMDLSQIKYQSLADPNAALTSPDDLKLKPIFEKCDSFAKQNQPRKASPCNLASQNNLKTICDGVYAERQPDGRLKTISRANAVQLHFEGKPWTIGVIENAEARATRLKQEEEEKTKQAAAAAAQKEAEEKDRKFKESPEYKKQQAEIERKRIAEEKELARKQAEIEKLRLAEEKQAAALKAKEEQERELKAQREKAAIEAQRAQEEKLRQQKSTVGINGSFRCANKVMINENNGQETFMKGDDVWSFSLNGATGVLITPTGKRELLTYQRSNTGPKATGHIYTFNNSEIMNSIQMNIDNVSSGQRKSALITYMKPVANMKILMMGFCDY